MIFEVEKINTEKGFVSQIVLTNASGASVTLSSLGAGIVAVNVPDRESRQSKVIAYYVPGNTADIWDYEIIDDDEVKFSIESWHKDGRKHTVSYRWTEDNVLEIYFNDGGAADILGQSYFNLDDNQDALTDEYLWINSTERPDFLNATQIHNRLVGNDVFVHHWHLQNWVEDVMNDAALLASHRNGRQLSIHTSFSTLCVVIPSSRVGISFAALPSPALIAQHSPQTTFLHFSPMK